MITKDDITIYLQEIISIQRDIDRSINRLTFAAKKKKVIIDYEKRKNDVLKLIYNELDIDI